MQCIATTRLRCEVGLEARKHLNGTANKCSPIGLLLGQQHEYGVSILLAVPCGGMSPCQSPVPSWTNRRLRALCSDMCPGAIPSIMLQVVFVCRATVPEIRLLQVLTAGSNRGHAERHTCLLANSYTQSGFLKLVDCIQVHQRFYDCYKSNPRALPFFHKSNDPACIWLTSAGLTEPEDVRVLRKGNVGIIGRALQDTYNEFERRAVGGLEVAGVYTSGSAEAGEVMAGLLQVMHNSGLARPTRKGETSCREYLACIHVGCSESSLTESTQTPDLHATLWSPSTCTEPVAATVSWLDYHHSFQVCHSSY